MTNAQNPIPARRNMSAPPLPPISAEAAQAEPEAERLSFERPLLTITIRAQLDGFPLEVELANLAGIDLVKRTIARLRELGAEPLGPAQPPPTDAQTNGKPAAKRASLRPMYNDDGEPICPVHKKPLRDGLYGLHCTARADGPDANEKGYCKLRFAE